MFQPDSPCVDAVRPSANFGERADGKLLDMIILHYTGMKSGKAALDWLCNVESGVSCHYFVEEDGTVFQLVAENMRAWHAGKSCWRGEIDINSRSIGIEIVNPGHEFGYRNFPTRQIEAVIELCLDCGKRLAIQPHYVLAHSDIAPLRKEDPGEKFPWQQLHEAGVGHWTIPEPVLNGQQLQGQKAGSLIRALQRNLASYGYPIELSGENDYLTRACITAFQRHFRPQVVDGEADQSTILTLEKLLQALAKNGESAV